jgi:hypothetical protein
VTAFGVQRHAVSRWLSRGQRFGLAGLAEGHRAGRPPTWPETAPKKEPPGGARPPSRGAASCHAWPMRLAGACRCRGARAGAWRGRWASVGSAAGAASTPGATLPPSPRGARTCAACTQPKPKAKWPWGTSLRAASRATPPCPTPGRCVGHRPCPCQPSAHPAGSRCWASGRPAPPASR